MRDERKEKKETTGCTCTKMRLYPRGDGKKRERTVGWCESKITKIQGHQLTRECSEGQDAFRFFFKQLAEDRKKERERYAPNVHGW